jgi:autotransporter-associated beta strand protein
VLLAQVIWDGGGGDNNWGTGLNWASDASPANDGTATVQFAGATRLTPNVDAAWSVAGLAFNSGASAFTVGGSALTIGTGGLTNNSTNLQSISAPITLGGAQSWNAASVNLTVSGTVANGGYLLTLEGTGTTGTASGIISGTGGLTKDASGTWVLSGVNTYTGTTTVSAGTLRAATSASALGAGNLTLSGGVLELANNTALNFGRNTTASGNITVTSDRTTAGAGVTHTLGTLSIGAYTLAVARGTLATSGTGGITFGATTLTGDATFSPGANALLTLGAVGGAFNLTKTGTGTLTLAAAGTYSGTTTVTSGTVNAARLANGGTSSSIGNSTNAAANLVLDGGTLNYTGATASSNRLFTLGTTGGTLSASGSAAVNFTNTGSLALSGTDTARTFTLGGSSAAANTFSPVITNNGAGATTLAKTGTGTWILNSANTYTGPTTVSSGALLLGVSAAISSANLSLAATTTGHALFGGQGSFTRGFGTGSGAVQLNGFSATIGAGFAAYGGALTVTPGNVTWGDTGFFSTTTGPLVFNTTISNNTVTWISDINLGATSRIFTVNDNTATAADYAIISGTLSGTGGLTKSGTGTLVLTGANTYTGATSITGGTLALSGSGAISSANLAINTGGVFATAGTFTRGFGTGAGQVALSSTSGGGFAAYGGALTLSLGSATWGTTTGFFSASTGPLILGSVNAHDVVTWTSDINLGALARTITVNDNISTTADYAVISGNFSGTGGLVKAGTGTLVLTGANTYSGVTQVSAGTLSAAALPDGVVSSSPIGTNATLKLGATTGTGTLLYTGTGGPTDRVIDLAGTTGGGVITNNGTGALVFTAPSFTATGAGAKTLTLSGTNTDANEIQGTIVNSTSATSLTKSGPGTWKLAGANTYTGTTTLSAGTLIAGNNAAFGTGSLAFSGGTLAGDGTTRTLANILTMGVSSTIGGASDLIFNGLLTNSASVTLTVANSAATTLSAVNLSNSGTGRTLTLNATGGDVTIGGVIANGGGSTTSGLTKTGPGTLLLSGANTYGGATTITNGTIRSGDNNVLPNTAVSLNATGANTISTLDLNDFNDTIGTLTFGGTTATSATAVTTGTGTLTLGGTVTYTATNNPLGAVIDGQLDLGGATRTFTIGNSTSANEDLTVNAAISGSGFGLTKNGAGTMLLTGANSYDGTTLINAGVLIIQTNTALGAVVNGTAVTATGAALELQNNITVTGEALSLTGTGVSNAGALRNISGANTWTGNITLAGATELQSDSGSLTISGNVSATNLGLTLDGAGNTALSGVVGLGTGGLTKTGAGTLTLAGNNAYAGATAVTSGAVKVTHNSGLSGTGATVSSNAALQFAQDAGSNNISVVAVGTTINGAGLGNGGAIQNLNGSNAYAGAITLGSNARITADSGSTLTLTGNLTGAGHALDAGGAGATVYNGVISGSGTTVTKTDAGTVTLGGSGANTFTGNLTVNDGTLNLNKTAGVNAVGTGNVIVGDGIGSASTANLVYQAGNQLPDAADITINSDGRLALGTFTDSVSTLTGTGLLDLGTSGHLTLGADGGASLFSGSITGSGNLEVAALGSLTLNSTISYNGTLTLGGGTLVLNASDLTVTNLVITGNSTIDFTGGSNLYTTNFSFLNSSVTLNIINWSKTVDYFYSSNWIGATQDLRDNLGAVPMSQVTFAGWTANDTGWDSYDDQIYPNVPEPSTYGLIMMGVGLAGFGYRRWRQTRPGKL